MSSHPNWTQDNVLQLALVGTAAGQAIVNVLHFTQASGTQDPAGAATACDALALDWETNCKASYVNLHGSGYVLTTIRATPVAVSGLAHVSLASHERIVTSGGGASGVLMDDMAAAAEYKLRTLEGGKSHRGRIYIGPLAAGAVVSGVVSGAGFLTASTAFVTAMDRYLAGGAAVANFALGVFSRPLHAGEQQWAVRVGGALVVRTNPAARAGDMTPVTTIVLDTTARTQRRRELGVGA